MTVGYLSLYLVERAVHVKGQLFVRQVRFRPEVVALRQLFTETQEGGVRLDTRRQTFTTVRAGGDVILRREGLRGGGPTRAI
ncbi:MAG TPA: hypothetical protein VF611_09635, partial [Pyrinomonadaceae bacterium]